MAGHPDLDDAGPRAITAYFQTYGPATLDHLYYWLGNGLSAGRKRLRTWFTELGDRLADVDVDGTTSYVLRKGNEIMVTWLDQRPQPTAALAREADRLGGILGTDLTLRVSSG